MFICVAACDANGGAAGVDIRANDNTLADGLCHFGAEAGDFARRGEASVDGGCGIAG